MLSYPAATAISAVTPSRVPASPLGALRERHIAVGIAMCASGTPTPTFLKDVALGVRAWSPPV
jgi:hypothetical protein